METIFSLLAVIGLIAVYAWIMDGTKANKSSKDKALKINPYF